MARGSTNWAELLAILLTGATLGCTQTPAVLDLTSPDPAHDQWKIAQFYSREATKLRQQADETSARVLVYERLFGPESDWVTGARLLAQSYEEAAKEAERSAGKHVGLATDGRPTQLVRPEAR